MTLLTAFLLVGGISIWLWAVHGSRAHRQGWDALKQLWHDMRKQFDGS